MSRLLLSSGLFLVVITLVFQSQGKNTNFLEDPWASEFTVASPSVDSLPPIAPRFEDFINQGEQNPFDLEDPSIVEQNVEYDPETGMYIITENIGEFEYRPSSFMTFSEYLEWKKKQEERNYFKKLGGVKVKGVDATLKDPIDKLEIDYNPFEQLFGGLDIDIQPQGNLDLTFGFNHSKTDNPIFPADQTSFTNFDFDMDIQMSLVGKIGEKLSLTTNYNTGSTFNFDNQIKLDYNSDLFGEDDILKRIEAGDVSLPLKGTLIQGAPSLFGLKTEMQFGHLRLTTIVSSQKTENENITLEGGALVKEFEVPVVDYDENRHFFLSHYNRANFESGMANLPYINSLFYVKNIEVWVTNDRNEVSNVRDVLALTDLGEANLNKLTNSNAVTINPNAPKDVYGQYLPSNTSNDLYAKLVENEETKDISKAVAILKNEFQLEQGRDFEKVSARKLGPSEYEFYPQLGFISLNINVRSDQVVAVSYDYDYDVDRPAYSVGQRAAGINDISTDQENPVQQVLFLKMLKSTNQRTDLPSWDLMMKNIYSIGAYGVDGTDFELGIYHDDPGKGVKNFLPESNLAGVPLLEVFGLDRLNSQQDPNPDGRFDFIEGKTINTNNGRVIFPVLEPFGKSLADKLEEQKYKDAYAYEELYTQTPFQAIENAERNRFLIKGRYKSSVSSEISLGAFNIPPGSVTVRAGGKILEEGIDYEVDYGSGRLRILQDAYLISGVPINVSFAEQNVFGLNQKTMLGLRADYEVSDKLNIGATAMKLFERPYTPKVNVGEDPINNNIYGLDVSFNEELPWLTKAINALPLISTKETSEVFFSAEGAYLSPGHAKAINASRRDKEGIVYLDDFEGSSSPTNLKTAPQANWFLASVPENDEQNNNPMFPEADAGGIIPGVNRAQLNWYTIFSSNRGGTNTVDNDAIIADPYNTQVRQTEIFPNVQLNVQDRAFTYQTLDLSFYPGERGPYNFDSPEGYAGYSKGLNLADGQTVKLNNPEERWGGIMRSIRNPDFQTSNIEFLEFWVLSPFLDNENSRAAAPNAEDRQGSLFINFGNISEDVLKDSRHFSENSLPTSPNDATRRVNETPWGLVPLNQSVTNSFDNTSNEARENQDVGLDGLNDAQEQSRFADYINALAGTNPSVAALVEQDPSNDNFRHYSSVDEGVTGQRRYYNFNNTQGNSNRAQGSTANSSTLRPDNEDINDDNSLNESESYFQYEIPFKVNPFDNREIDMQNTPFITDRIEDPGNGRVWYRFKVPLRTEQKTAIGGINDFRSIRFMRMYMKGFKAPVTLRLGSLELVRNSWRRYTQDLVDPRDIDGVIPSCGNDVTFEIDAVSIEENSGRIPFNYTLPPGIAREQNIGVVATQQNEQSLVLKTKELCDGDARGVFKVVETDMRVYDRLKMFVHAEEVNEEEVPTGGMSVFIRLGKDMRENYYEYEIPLVMSDPDVIAGLQNTSLAYKEEVWRRENEFDFALSLLKELKKERNGANFDLSREYTKELAVNGNTHTVKVKGNPNLGLVKIAMIGIRNPFNNDGASYSTEIWANELRFTGLDEKGGVAGIARMDVTLADLGSFSASTDYSSFGFGALNEGVHERSMEKKAGYDMSVELNLDKFLPEKSGIKIPFYAQTSNSTITPEFDPYDLDLTLEEKMDEFENQAQKDSIRNQAIEKVTRRSFNFTNVRKEKTGGSQKSKPWDVENLSATYSWSETKTQTPFIEFEDEKQQKGSLDYAYSNSPTYIKPFKFIKKDKHLKFLTNFNFNPLPNSFTFSNFLDRRFIATRYRFSELSEVDGTYYTKYFTWDREYNLNWNLASSLKFNFNALSKSIIDEPDEKAMRKDPTIKDVDAFRRDSIWTNIAQLGRAKNYSHNFSVNYTLPIRYLPYMEWVTVKAQYQGDYAWSAPGLAFTHLGNTIQNGQKRQINGDFNFVKLYDKSKYLKKINRGKKRKKNTKKRGTVGVDKDKDKDKNKSRSKKSKKGNEPTEIERILIRPLMLVRRAKINYRENFQTVVPGFTPETSLLGMSSGFAAPGWDFIAGLQPNIANVGENQIGTNQDWLYANRSWITADYGLNDYVVQDYSQTIDAQLTLEPVRDFKITLDAKKTYSKNHTQRFKNTLLDNGGDDYVHGLATENGAMTITYSALNTMFMSSDDQLDRLFKQIDANQIILSQRLGTGSHQDPNLAEQGFTNGYGRNQQDIQIPAFIAAYTEQDAATMDLDLFSTLPRVNWRINYDGLSKVGFFREYLDNFSLQHGYKSTLTVNNYKTNAYYQNTPDHFDSEETYDFYTRYEIPNIVITEGFEPLIGVSATMQNGMNFEFNYSRTRNLSLSAINNSLSERLSKDWSITYGWLLKDIDIPFLTGSKKKKGKKKKEEEELDKKKKKSGAGRGRRLEGRDLDIQFNMALRDDVEWARQLDSGDSEKVNGNYELSLSPSVEYKLNKQLSLRLFFDYRRTLPVTSAVAERVTSAGGVVVRFEL